MGRRSAHNNKLSIQYLCGSGVPGGARAEARPAVGKVVARLASGRVRAVGHSHCFGYHAALHAFVREMLQV